MPERAPNLRVEAIKCYLGVLWSQGCFVGCKTPMDVIAVGARVFADDAREAVGDLAFQLAQQAAGNLGQALSARFTRIVSDLHEQGFEAVWEKLTRGRKKRR